jgi:hypothetical protein
MASLMVIIPKASMLKNTLLIPNLKTISTASIAASDHNAPMAIPMSDCMSTKASL